MHSQFTSSALSEGRARTGPARRLATLRAVRVRGHGHRRLSRTLALIAIAALAGPVRADVVEGVSAYNNQDYETARRLLAGPAGLGDSRAQFAMGAMLVKGQGGDKDMPAGLAWLLASADNGYADAKAQVEGWRANVSHLSVDDRIRVADLLKENDLAGVARRLLPRDVHEAGCNSVEGAAWRQTVSPSYPRQARREAQNAALLIAFKVGIDGMPREPEVLSAFPDHKDFNSPAIRSILSSRYWPARSNGQPTEQTIRIRTRYEILGGGYLWSADGLRKAVDQAEGGGAKAQFFVGAVILSDSRALGFTPREGRDFIVKAAKAGDGRAQYWVGQELAGTPECGHSAEAERWLREASRNSEPAAQVRLARMILAANPSAEQQSQARGLLSEAARSASEFAARQAIAVLATSPYEPVRDAALAASIARTLKIEDYDLDPQTWDALAVASAAGGDYWQAIRHEEKAIKLADGYRFNALPMVVRLESFKQKQAWIGDFFAAAPLAETAPIPAGIPACNSTVLPGPYCYIEHPARKPPAIPPR